MGNALPALGSFILALLRILHPLLTAGHAVPIKDDIYLVTYDFEDSDVEDDASMHLSMRWLWEKLYQSSGAGCVLIILDCCYAGNIVDAKDDPYKIDLHKLLDKWSGESNESTLHNRTRHILTATGYDIKAQELDGHGLMTGLLIRALRGLEDEALDREGNVEIGSLYSYLRDKMPERQKPDLAGKLGLSSLTCMEGSSVPRKFGSCLRGF